VAHYVPAKFIDEYRHGQLSSKPPIPMYSHVYKLRQTSTLCSTTVRSCNWSVCAQHLGNQKFVGEVVTYKE